ncbi:MFS transporter, partial [Strepomyces sp. STD 3.1]|nr:MFS transporter [Streptomyces sp. STD 3.1]
WMAYLLSFVDRLSWPPIMPLASKDLAINSTQAGGLMTAFYIGYVITQFPGGLLVDRYGYRKVLLFSFLAMGSFTLFTGFAHSYEQAFLIRVLVGIGELFFLLLCQSYSTGSLRTDVEQRWVFL